MYSARGKQGGGPQCPSLQAVPWNTPPKASINPVPGCYQVSLCADKKHDAPGEETLFTKLLSVRQ